MMLQVFRSIDSGSVKGFPKVVQEAEAQVGEKKGNCYILGKCLVDTIIDIISSLYFIRL